MKIATAFLALVVSLPAIASATAGRFALVAFFIALFSILYSLFSFAPFAYADCTYTQNPTSPTSDQEIINQFNKCAIEKNIYDDKIFNFNQITGTVDSLNTMITGYSNLHPETNALTQNRSTVSLASNLVAGLYSNPPASGVEYLATQFQKFNPIQPAYAQGVGYNTLSPIQQLWTVFRNASYVGFIIVFVVIGFMVMFRAHISAQAVATVQDSLPRIVIALILVTFSYAIAGLMIDIMFLVINIVIQLLGQSGVLDVPKASDAIFKSNVLTLIIGSGGSTWLSLVGTTATAIGDMLKAIIDLGSIGNLLVFIGLGGIGGLIVGIAAIFIIFRLFMMLLMAYITIILLTLFAPFFFLIQALPGNNGAKEWFKQMASNIAVFPAVAMMIMLAGIIAGISNWGGTGVGEFQKVGESAKDFPLLFSGLNAGTIGKIIGLGILFMTPQAAELVKNALSIKGGPNLGAGLVGGIAAGATAGRQIGSNIAYRTPGLRNIADMIHTGAEEPKIRQQAAVQKRMVKLGAPIAYHPSENEGRQ